MKVMNVYLTENLKNLPANRKFRQRSSTAKEEKAKFKQNKEEERKNSG